MSGDANAKPVEAPRPHPDGRKLWEWETKYEEALPRIQTEAILLGTYLIVFGTASLVAFAHTRDLSYPFGADLAKATFYVRRRDVLVFLVGSVGGVTFAIKWLVHSVANGLWHQDRFLWRIFVPLTGGIYALVVLGLTATGYMGGGTTSTTADAPGIALTRELVLAFLAGYFADGVSGLLTNVANAIFGKVDKK